MNNRSKYLLTKIVLNFTKFIDVVIEYFYLRAKRQSCTCSHCAGDAGAQNNHFGRRNSGNAAQ